MHRVGIIDYGLCNIDSVARAIETNGGRATITRDPAVVGMQDLLVLPGVGAFGAAMDNLQAWGLADAIREQVTAGLPLLGICLGMQLLAESSEESPGARGLGLIEAEVVRLKTEAPDERIPHMGWNAVTFSADEPLFNGIESGTDFYFVHSYHMRCRRAEEQIGMTPFCGAFTSVVRSGAVVGAQFHPEKSWPAGHKLLQNFIAQGPGGDACSRSV